MVSIFFQSHTRRHARLLGAALLLSFVSHVIGQVDQTQSDVRKIYACQFVADPPQVDGDISDSAWSIASWADVIAQQSVEPNNATRVRAKLLWDDVYLYFAAEVYDATPRCVHFERDQNVWNDDCFEIYVSPEGHGRFYELDINSAGAVWDSFGLPHHTGRHQHIRSWTAPSLKVKTRQHEGGWTLEGRICIDEFVGINHVRPNHGDRLRINLFYIDTLGDSRKQLFYAWSPTQQFKDVERFGEMRFVDRVGGAKDRQQQAFAKLILNSEQLPQMKRADFSESTIRVSGPAAGEYTFSPKTLGWRPGKGFGRVTPIKSDEHVVQRWRLRPNEAGDPANIDYTSDQDGQLVVIARLNQKSAKLIEQGLGDGVWLRISAQGDSEVIRLSDHDWRACTAKLSKGESVRISIDAGPAGNRIGDSAEAIFLFSDTPLQNLQPPQVRRSVAED